MSRFDQQYYQRFYDGPDGVHDPAQVAHLATAVHHLCAWWGVTPTTVLDVGAGVGMWRDWYRATHPEVHVVSVDISPYACERWGHEQRDIVTWRPATPFDLVICHGVVHYLDDAGAEPLSERCCVGPGVPHLLWRRGEVAGDADALGASDHHLCESAIPRAVEDLGEVVGELLQR